MVPAKRVLARSLNVPMVRLLQDYGLEKFHFGLQQLNLYSIDQPPSHYGLTLILGGAESSLWEISNAYAGMARTLNHFQPNDGRYDPQDFQSANLRLSTTEKEKTIILQKEAPVLSASACWHTLEAMRSVERPNSEGEWERFGSGKKIAWKTGRDEMRKIAICQQSGLNALRNCPIDTLWLGPGGERLESCHFHQQIYLDSTEQYRVNSDCQTIREMHPTTWFVLPPVEEFYYRNNHPSYRPLPPIHPDCSIVHNNTTRILPGKYTGFSRTGVKSTFGQTYAYTSR